MAASPNVVSHMPQMLFTLSEATPAQRRVLFYLSNSADGTPATGKTIAGSDFRISKNGAAFGDAAGAVTELSLGWYQMEFAAADLDTLGCLACEVSVEAGVDTIHVAHQVTALDHNTATVNPGANGITAATINDGALDAATFVDGSITAAKLGADALAAINGGIEQRRKVMTRLTANGQRALSMDGAIQVDIDLTGDDGGGSVQAQTCEDPAATVPVWTDRGSPSTTLGRLTVAGPHKAVRINLTGSTTPTLDSVFTLTMPAGLVR